MDPCQCDWDGQTACDLARAYQRDALAAYLEVRRALPATTYHHPAIDPTGGWGVSGRLELKRRGAAISHAHVLETMGIDVEERPWILMLTSA